MQESWLRGVDLNHRPLGYEPNRRTGTENRDGLVSHDRPTRPGDGAVRPFSCDSLDADPPNGFGQRVKRPLSSGHQSSPARSPSNDESQCGRSNYVRRFRRLTGASWQLFFRQVEQTGTGSVGCRAESGGASGKAQEGRSGPSLRSLGRSRDTRLFE